MAVTWTTQRTGNWSLISSNASSPWHDGGTQTGYARTPGSSSNANDDIVVIANGHTLTCDASVTCGDSANPTTAYAIANASSTGTGILSVSTGVTLTVVSRVQQANATWTFAAGSGLTFNSGSALTWQIGAAHSQANAGLNLSGTSCSRVTVQSTGAANGSFTAGFIGAGKCVCTYVDFVKIGTTSVAAWVIYPSSTYAFSWKFCTWDADCGRIEATTGLAAGTVFELEDCVHLQTGQCLSAALSGSSDITTGTRSIRRNYFAGLLGTQGSGGQWRGCSIIGNVCSAINGTAGASTGTGAVVHTNVIRRQITNTMNCAFGTDRTVGWNYLHLHSNAGSLANPHPFSFNGSADTTFSGWIFDPGDTDRAGDWISASSPAAARSYAVEYCLYLPIGAGSYVGGHSGTALSALGSANFSCSVTHCTWVCYQDTAENGGVRGGETYAGYAGMFSAIKSNIAWSPTADTAAIYLRTGTAATVASDICEDEDADYNATWNAITTGAAGSVRGYKDYVTTPTNPMFSTTANLGANDVTLSGNPFVDVDMGTSSWRNIASWAVHKSQASGGDSYNDKCDAAYDYFAAGPAAGDLDDRISDLIEWVKAGWKVNDASLEDAGHDAATIGALDYASASGNPYYIAGAMSGGFWGG
jgi:hypothetical protein